MSTRKIFLSYRRGDSPGYVSRLETDLENAFGDGRVFRDVEDIKGGTQWKHVLEQALADSAVVLLVIGPRWAQIWEERKDAPGINYVSFELLRARELGIPVVPVTVDGATLPTNVDLGDIDWILDNQNYDISDRQGRWRTDLAGLVALLETVDAIGPARKVDDSPQPEEKKSRKGGWLKIAAIVIAVLLVAGYFAPTEEPVPPVATPSTPVVEPEPVVDNTPAPSTIPDITGTWQGQDGTLYYVQQFSDGTFKVESPGYANGSGRFLGQMPGKFAITMHGVGSGEFAVSTTGDRAMGYIVVNGQQEFDTLTRVE